MFGYGAPQRLPEVRDFRSQLSPCQPGDLRRVVFAPDDCLDHLPAGRAQDMGGDRPQVMLASSKTFLIGLDMAAFSRVIRVRCGAMPFRQADTRARSTK